MIKIYQKELKISKKKQLRFDLIFKLLFKQVDILLSNLNNIIINLMMNRPEFTF